eukprot:TRINITY_DN9957_c0_g1_i3.p1 TRINITY_DN9957_c0_g1~~TRINITY_DN9957_c0_g1_i3.p1  ORF type:complete len:337 (+),score=42.87 TRINITY_DN9957_c0_g1_i3:30-1013(+)
MESPQFARRNSRPVVDTIKRLDWFPKPIDDVREHHSFGAIVTLIGCVLIGFLVMSELYDYASPTTQDTIFVDVSRQDKMLIELDITLINLQCNDAHLDFVDTTGQEDISISQDIEKIEVNGEEEISDSNSVFKAFSALRNNQVKTGCRIRGTAWVQKVEGNFHIAAGSSNNQDHGAHKHHMHHIQQSDLGFDVSHRVNHFAFGTNWPGRVSPLDGVIVRKNAMTQVNYMIKVVPTIFEKSSGEQLNTHQFSVTENVKESVPGALSFPLPGVFFKWELSPFMIKYSQSSGTTLAQFLTRLCAIAGGTFVVFGLAYKGARITYGKVKRS